MGKTEDRVAGDLVGDIADRSPSSHGQRARVRAFTRMLAVCVDMFALLRQVLLAEEICLMRCERVRSPASSPWHG